MGRTFSTFIITILIIVFLYLRSISKIKYTTNIRVEKFNLELEARIDNNIFNDISRKLIFAGFEHQGNYKVEADEMGSVDYLKSFIYKELSTKATIVYTDIKKDGRSFSKYTFTISTNFKDGYKVITRDNSDSYLFKENNAYIKRINNLEDVNDAIKEHIEKVKELSKDKELSPINEDYEVQLKKDMYDDFRDQARLGVLKQYNGDCYKFTLKGMVRGSLILTKFSFKSLLKLFYKKESPFASKQEKLAGENVDTSNNKMKSFKVIMITLCIYAGIFFIIVMSVLLRR